MTQDQLKKIVSEENETLERNAIQEARSIIGAISQKKLQITRLEHEIKDLQASMKKIEIKQFDPIQILGE